jgi:hypothetical protein
VVGAEWLFVTTFSPPMTSIYRRAAKAASNQSLKFEPSVVFGDGPDSASVLIRDEIREAHGKKQATTNVLAGKNAALQCRIAGSRVKNAVLSFLVQYFAPAKDSN